MKDLEEDEIENMVKIILDDSSVLPFESTEEKERVGSLGKEKKETAMDSDEESLIKKNETESDSDVAKKNESRKLKNETKKNEGKSDSDAIKKNESESSSDAISDVLSMKKDASKINSKADALATKKDFIKSSEDNLQSNSGAASIKNEINKNKDIESDSDVISETSITKKDFKPSNSKLSEKDSKLSNSKLSEKDSKLSNSLSENDSDLISDFKALAIKEKKTSKSNLISDLDSLDIKDTKNESIQVIAAKNNKNTEESSDEDKEDSKRNESVNENDSSSENQSNSDSKTDLATCNDSDIQIYDISEVKIPESLKKQDFSTFYQNALEFTTQGKFIKAIENFKIAISLIALKIDKNSDFLEIRKRIGNYFLGLYIEKKRKSVDDPILSIQMSMFFSNLDLDTVHIPLVKNLALTTCFKNGNFKTAKKIAKEFPQCRNASKVLASADDEDALVVVLRPFYYGSLLIEPNAKECALCGVKSTEGEICPACEIGCLH